MNRSIVYSLFLHGILLLVLIFGLPSFFKEIPDDTVVTVEVLPISAVSNVKPAQRQPTPQKPTPPKPEPVKKAEPPQPKPEPKTEPKPVPKVEPVKMEDAIPLKPTVKPKPPKKEEPKKPEPKPEPKKEEKKPDPKKEKPKEKDLFDSLEKDLQKKAEEKQKQEAFDSLEESLTKKTTKTYDPSVPLSISETDAIRQQFYSCWTPPVGARDLENMSAVVHITIEKDGTVSNVALVPNAQYSGDSFYQVFAESAVRAVHKCSPLKVMPSPDKFSSWHEMELTFNPKDMF